MRYKIEVYNIWELGKRANQEDSLFPGFNQQTPADRLFILCDGMGGHASGEVASSTVCQAMSQSIMSMCPDPEGAFTDEILQQAISDAFGALDAVDPNDGSLKKMGTTMTFLKLHDNGATIAHMGDSRVYHVRPGQTAEDTQILFVTEDHSLVNDLVKIGELTPEEARTSRQKNVITRAMQPHTERRCKADVYEINDVESGDYFFLCCDGVLEQLTNSRLGEILANGTLDDAGKIKAIKAVCDGKTRDNYTCWLVPIDVVEQSSKAAVPDDVALVVSVEEEVQRVPEQREQSSANMVFSSVTPHVQKGKRKTWMKVLAGLIVLVLIVLGVGYVVLYRSDYLVYLRDMMQNITQDIRQIVTYLLDKYVTRG